MMSRVLSRNTKPVWRLSSSSSMWRPLMINPAPTFIWLNADFNRQRSLPLVCSLLVRVEVSFVHTQVGCGSMISPWNGPGSGRVPCLISVWGNKLVSSFTTETCKCGLILLTEVARGSSREAVLGVLPVHGGILGQACFSLYMAKDKRFISHSCW